MGFSYLAPTEQATCSLEIDITTIAWPEQHWPEYPELDKIDEKCHIGLER